MGSDLPQKTDMILCSTDQVITLAKLSWDIAINFVLVSWMSDTSSISGLSGISNISSRTFVCEESSLVLEVQEPDRHHYYLVPLQVYPNHIPAYQYLNYPLILDR